MYETASPTVLRFLTSSSGIGTPNFSSAFTTIVIIERESMSRSSVKLLSGWTASTARPVSSLTISARPSRISCSLCAMRMRSFGRFWPVRAVLQAVRMGVGTLRQLDDLGRVGEPGAEADEQGEAAVRRLALLEHAFHRQRDGGRRGVARLLDVVRHRDGLGQPQ